jgi:ABC-type uncharacterized transport system ATPase subunit
VIGYLPEERGLYKQMKVWELLVFLAETKGRRPAETKKKVDAWLERLSSPTNATRRSRALERQSAEVQLIATLLHDPDLIILDEPQSGLDPVNLVLVRNLLRDLRHEGKTILLSTHDGRSRKWPMSSSSSTKARSSSKARSKKCGARSAATHCTSISKATARSSASFRR